MLFFSEVEYLDPDESDMRISPNGELNYKEIITKYEKKKKLLWN
jgi:hypothetical protein